MPVDVHDSVRYHLRYQIAPTQDVSELSVSLAEFCAEHGIEEVVLFFAFEAWNNGLLSAEEEDTWFEALKTTHAVLTEAGIICSLNPWMTVLHTDRGRSMPSDRSFAPMVGPKGRVTKAVASFADPAWRDYIANLYGHFAELGLRVLWVEDDYRFHNHAPLEWGGGFEPELIARFENKIGAKVSREQLVAAILQPGAPHPWRSVWIETWKDCHLEVAKIIADATNERAPNDPIIGLMTSSPSSHSVEGRDWSKLFDVFTINGGFAHRPHFASYSETPGPGRARSVLMLDIQRRYWADHVEVAPEIENFPMSAWNKSDTQTWCEMALAQFYGADAMLLDIMPFAGVPAPEERGIGEMLDQTRPALGWIKQHLSRGMNTRGVGLPWREDAASRVHTDRGESMVELQVDPFDAGEFLLPYGVPITTDEASVNAVFGKMAWVHDDDEMNRLLAGGLIIDGEAAAILGERGFADLIGVSFEGWLERDASPYAIERTETDAYGIRPGVDLDMNQISRAAKLEPVGGDEWTTVYSPVMERIGGAVVAFENSLGGRVVTYAVPNPAELPRSYYRQAVAKAAVEFCGRGAEPGVVVSGTPHLMPMDFNSVDGTRIVVVMNGATDAGNAVVRVLDAPESDPTATVLGPLSVPHTIDASISREDGAVVVKPAVLVPSQGFLIVSWE
jgi:hypothetical protein